MDSPDMKAFYVWSWRTPNNGNTLWQDFNKVQVNYDEIEEEWTYEPKRWWEFYNTYSFYAIYPISLPGLSCNHDGKFSFDAIDIKQDTEYDTTKAIDFLQAKSTDLEVEMNPPKYVNLTFSHMLTNININLKKSENNSNDKMEVTYILLNGMDCVGSMTDDVWTLSEPSYFWDKLETPQLLNDKASSCFSNVLMLPQTIAENQVALYVVYSYQQAGGTAMTKTLETYLPAGEWKAGEKIVYTGTIQVDNNIVFETPQVESWGTEQVGGTIIIQ